MSNRNFIDHRQSRFNQLTKELSPREVAAEEKRKKAVVPGTEVFYHSSGELVNRDEGSLCWWMDVCRNCQNISRNYMRRVTLYTCMECKKTFPSAIQAAAHLQQVGSRHWSKEIKVIGRNYMDPRQAGFSQYTKELSPILLIMFYDLSENYQSSPYPFRS